MDVTRVPGKSAGSLRIRASVACYHCGHVSGHIVADTVERIAFGIYHDAAVPDDRGGVPVSGLHLRCHRCGGPVFLGEVETFRAPNPVVVTWSGRGRPPARPRPEVGYVVREAGPMPGDAGRVGPDGPRRLPHAPRPQRHSA